MFQTVQVGKYLWSTYDVQVFLMKMKGTQQHIMLKNQEAESQWQKGLTQKNIKTLREQTSCYGEHSN